MASIRDVLDAAVIDRLMSVGGGGSGRPEAAVQDAATGAPTAGDEHTKSSDPGHVPVPQRRESARSRSGNRQVSVPPQGSRQLDKAHADVAAVARRLAELTRLMSKSPGLPFLVATRRKHQLMRDNTRTKARLIKMRARTRDRSPELGRAIAHAREVERRIQALVIPSPPPPHRLPAGRALSPPRQLRPNTPGPDSPNYYQDPINSK